MSWQAFGASVQGVSHKRLKLPCQDACKWQVLPHGVVCAVADGLGSAARADIGAKLAVAAVVRMLANLPPDTVATQVDVTVITATLRAAMLAARTALAHHPEDHALQDYATTLLVAWVTDTWTGIAQIGDGAIVGCWPDGRLETLSLPQQGEYVNETIPLTAADALERLYVKSWPERLATVALFTDGLQNLAINLQHGTPYAPFFTPFFTAVQQFLDSEAVSMQLAAFLDSERVCAKTDDDKTLVIAGYREV